MSLRLRVVLIAGLALSMLWSGAAAWLAHDLHRNLDRTLDHRLAMSARMVSGLLQRSAVQSATATPMLSGAVSVGGGQGIACQIRSLRGEVLAATGDAALAGRIVPAAGFADVFIDGAAWRTYTLQAGDFLVTTADRSDERDALVRGLLTAAAVPMGLAVLGGLLALWIGIGRGLQPLDALRRKLQNRDIEATSPLDDRRAPRELQPLLQALNGLLERLAAAIAQQRAFTDAAAHELRTPLTGIDTHLQIARMGGDANVPHALRQADQGVRRLARTLDQMLALARAESAVPEGDACDSIQSALEDALAWLEPAARGRIVRVGADDRATPIPHSMLATAVRNLLDNALRYTPDESIVQLGIVCDDGEGKCRITIADRGDGMTSAQIAQAGQRFWRGDAERPGRAGAGLGISIVRAIAARHGGRLDLAPRAGGGLVATLLVAIT
ncbi:ATP-binding protein [Stenotrophomonas sp. PS02297]|uniref:ATP-binding protein n=1 Tax=unclassified Stenotrophomonas TaxID=196198 RepID=UPI00249A8C12|nr:ATP-binding protein [Stenotrophomonas sp. PS02297]